MRNNLIALYCMLSLTFSGYAFADTNTEIEKLKAEVEKLKTDVQKAAEWKQPNTLIHLAGYADVGYTSNENNNDSFTVGSFSPIFHFQYRDLVMLEAELEIEIENDGNTSTAMEYMTIDVFLNDYMVLLAGKFLSPIGQFRQNLHPSWINKMPSAPPGFGHDGAAPTSDIGLQLRGGHPIGDVHTSYAVYIANGPELNTENNGTEYELEGVVAEGFNVDSDNKKVIGGRFAVLPLVELEIAVSYATGKATVTSDGSVNLPGEEARDYEVMGVDFAYQRDNFFLRGEYVKTDVGDATTGTSASEGGKWTSWYTQAAYQFFPIKLEPVLRYTDFDSVGTSNDQTQWMFGINYLISNSTIAKLAYEMNDGEQGTNADDDRWLIQLAYGF